MSRKMKHNLALVGICLFVLIGVVVAVLAVSPRNVMSGPPGETHVANSQQYPVPLAGLDLPLVQLEGQWYYKKDGTAFVATIQGRDIKIDWITDEGTSMLYWHGTFETAESPGHVIASTKTEAHDEIVMSQSQSKDFTINNNSIVFDFAAMGFKTKVTLTR